MCYSLWYNAPTILPAGSLDALVPDFQPATSWLHYTTSCNSQSSAPEDVQNNLPKLVELIGNITKPLLLNLVGCPNLNPTQFMESELSRKSNTCPYPESHKPLCNLSHLISLKIISIIRPYLDLDISNGFIPSGFPFKILYTFLSLTCVPPAPSI